MCWFWKKRKCLRERPPDRRGRDPSYDSLTTPFPSFTVTVSFVDEHGVDDGTPPLVTQDGVGNLFSGPFFHLPTLLGRRGLLLPSSGTQFTVVGLVRKNSPVMTRHPSFLTRSVGDGRAVQDPPTYEFVFRRRSPCRVDSTDCLWSLDLERPNIDNAHLINSGLWSVLP